MRGTRRENCSEQMIFELLDTEEAPQDTHRRVRYLLGTHSWIEKFAHQAGSTEPWNFKYVNVFNALEVTRLNLAGGLSGQRWSSGPQPRIREYFPRGSRRTYNQNSERSVCVRGGGLVGPVRYDWAQFWRRQVALWLGNIGVIHDLDESAFCGDLGKVPLSSGLRLGEEQSVHWNPMDQRGFLVVVVFWFYLLLFSIAIYQHVFILISVILHEEISVRTVLSALYSP